MNSPHVLKRGEPLDESSFSTRGFEEDGPSYLVFQREPELVLAWPAGSFTMSSLPWSTLAERVYP